MAVEQNVEEGLRPSSPTVAVWDPVVRLFHWTVVAACVLNLFILEEGHYWHRVTGYVVAGALVTRFLWGFVGSRYARFAEFLPTASKVREQLSNILRGNHVRYIGHNPLASVMMLMLMALLAVTCTTGWMTTLDAFWGNKLLEEVHGIFANAIMVLAGVHALAAIVESRLLKENLVLAMVTGRKRR